MDSRYGRSFSGSSNNSQYKRYSRSRSRSRERCREQVGYRRRQLRSRSRDTTLNLRRDDNSMQDLYRELINNDYKREGSCSYISHNNYEHRQHRRDDDGDRRENYNRHDDHFDRRDHKSDRRDNNSERRDTKYDRPDNNCNTERGQRWKNYNLETQENDKGSDRGSISNRIGDRSDRKPQHQNGHGRGDKERDNERGYQQNRKRRYSDEASSNTVVVFDLSPDCTKETILELVRQVNLEPAYISRKKIAGSSREIAFVEFSCIEEAKQWMDINQGRLHFGDHRYIMDYGHKRNTDWHCIKCGANNFRSRSVCYMCKAPWGSGNGEDDGLDEVTYIISKKIMLRNLDALTNEEGVLTALQRLLPDLAKTVSRVEISRDKLTQTSRGICYLHFETLIESMNVHNGLIALDPPLTIDDKAVTINYCTEPEIHPVVPRENRSSNLKSKKGIPTSIAGGSYTLADVPHLAEYSASMYASNPLEKAQYLQYYTDYYKSEISKGNRVDSQLTEANSGAAVALQAIQRKQQKATGTPKGNDGKTYPIPNVASYQYDETSGFYYDPSTGLYYDAHSQYYYNNETGAYLYWDQSRSTYVLASHAATQTGLAPVMQSEVKEENNNSEKESNGKPDKVKVAKMIVKDMEKWAKQLNQKKDYTVVATPQPILNEPTSTKLEGPSTSRAATKNSSGCADVGFAIMEKKERVPVGLSAINKLNGYGDGSDSEEDKKAVNEPASHVSTMSKSTGDSSAGSSKEMPLVDFEKLTCLLCKRAFQSLDTLQKHLKISNLHKENIAKLNRISENDDGSVGGLSYRDRAKERRLKHGDSDEPPTNRNREHYQRDLKNIYSKRKQKDSDPVMPIASSNVGSRLLQKMGWSEGQGLGRKNQGRTHIIEAPSRSDNLGLGNKASDLRPDVDYNTYVKKMMKQRYENS